MEKKIKMKKLIFILSLFCSTLFAQKVIIVDINTGKEYLKDFPSRSDTVIGLADNLRLYFILQKKIPQYDYLTERPEQVKRFTDSIADGNKYPYCVYEWVKVKLPDETVKENKEQAVRLNTTELIFNSLSDEEFRLYVLSTLYFILDEIKLNNLNDEQKIFIDTIVNMGQRIYENHVIETQLIKDIEINKNIDIINIVK